MIQLSYLNISIFSYEKAEIHRLIGIFNLSLVILDFIIAYYNEKIQLVLKL